MSTHTPTPQAPFLGRRRVDDLPPAPDGKVHALWRLASGGHATHEGVPIVFLLDAADPRVLDPASRVAPGAEVFLATMAHWYERAT